MNQDWVYFNRPGKALKPFPSSVGWGEIWTHEPLIVNLVRYPLDQAFALGKVSLGKVC